MKNYGDFAAVTDISFDVAQGGSLRFCSRMAGKTTALKILTTPFKPTSGEVGIGGLNPAIQTE